MNLLFTINDLRALPLLTQLFYRNGKKDGQGYSEEVEEVVRRHPTWITILGDTHMSAQELIQEYAKKGKKILHIKKKEDKTNG